MRESDWSSDVCSSDLSLSIGVADDRVLINCHAGCATEDVLRALGLEWKDLFVGDAPTNEPGTIGYKDKWGTVEDIYRYTNANGEYLYEVWRYIPKDFRARKRLGPGEYVYQDVYQDNPPVLYRLPKVLKALASDEPILLVEGEKDVHTLEAWGLTATTNPHGAKAWKSHYADTLAGARVIVVPDNDAAGEAWLSDVTSSVSGVAKTFHVIRLPNLRPGGDVTDWKNAGGTAEKFARIFQEQTQPVRRARPLDEYLQWVVKHTVEPLPPAVLYPAWGGINDWTNGMRPGWLTYLAGYTSHGKTAAALEVCESVVKRGQRVLMISCEMRPEDIAVRIGQRWGMDSRRFFKGMSNAEDKQAVNNALYDGRFNRMSIYYTRQIPEIEKCLQEDKPDILVVDYLGLLDIGRHERREGTTVASHALKDIALRYNIPVLSLIQLRRPERRRGDSLPMPTLYDLKDSGATEQDADQVLFVYQETDTETWRPMGFGSIIVAKSRMGETGAVWFGFDGARQQFHMMTKDECLAAIKHKKMEL
jgi:hypothetical protein